MTTQQKWEKGDALIKKYGADAKLCELPDAEFDFGGDFDELARIEGYAGGRALANEGRLWSLELDAVLSQLIS